MTQEQFDETVDCVTHDIMTSFETSPTLDPDLSDAINDFLAITFADLLEG